jgi:hypothetical protein
MHLGRQRSQNSLLVEKGYVVMLHIKNYVYSIKIVFIYLVARSKNNVIRMSPWHGGDGFFFASAYKNFPFHFINMS